MMAKEKGKVGRKKKWKDGKEERQMTTGDNFPGI
jgi:hypothetical protein